MSRSRILKNNFRAGVLAPTVMGLTDSEFYNNGLRQGKNIIIETVGGMKRRSGTVFIREYGNIDFMRIFPFTFNRDQKYIVTITIVDESTTQMDIYRDDVLVAGNIVVPYSTREELEALDFAQSADVMIFTEGITAPYMLRRLGDDATWDFIPVPIVSPPQYDPDRNEPPVLEDMWTEALGYPQHCTFHQGRLWFAGSKSFPQNVWSSQSQDFFNFDLGTGLANESIQEALDTDFINPIVNIFSARTLQVFTRGDEFNNSAQVLTPLTSSWERQTNYGSEYNVPPVAVDGATLFVDSSGRAIRKFTYVDEEGGFDAPDISATANHLVKIPTRMGVLRGRALEASNFVFVVNSDGTIATLNISKTHDLLAWTEWTTQGFYRDIVTIDDETYILVERFVNSKGVYVTYNGELVVDGGVPVWYNEEPNVSHSSWMLERLSDVMLVDSGSVEQSITDSSVEKVARDENNFFGVYFAPSGAGKVVIVRGAFVVYKADFLKGDPTAPYLDANDKRYTALDVFSYNKAVREKYFTEEFSYQWYMYTLIEIQTVFTGRNYIDGLTHLLGMEVVSTLDGNIQHPQVVVNGDSVETVERSYPDGIDWRYGEDNQIVETIVDGVSRELIVTYDAVAYENPILTDYGYLIEGVTGEVDSVYLQKGVTIDNTDVFYTTETLTANGVFSPAPFEDKVGLCMCGAGGSGEGITGVLTTSGGGFAGAIFSGDIDITPHQDINFTIGVGGLGVISPIQGNAGSATSFGAYKTVAGGAGGSINTRNGHRGNGASRTTCGGTFNDGHEDNETGRLAYGGQAGAFGNGGFGRYFNPAGNGGVGAGGGATTQTGGGGERTGAGGRGQIVVTHTVGQVTTLKSEVRKMVLVASETTDGIVVFPDAKFRLGQAGLFFPVVAETMPLSVSAGAGSLVNEPKRIVSVTTRYKDTQGVFVNGIELPERRFGEEVLDEAPPLLTGIEKNRHLGYNRETTVTIVQNDPMPFTLLSLDIEINY